MTAYYNEIEPYASNWLRNLIDAGLIASGDVDARRIEEVSPDDVRGYRQAHFFAGIGGWPLALRLAGWPDDRPVWTGSCPCQPYSAAGKGLGDADPRNLWPQFCRLIRQCRPDCIFGEQVASAIGHGWLDRVSADLEAEGYAIGTVVLGAHSVGAPHIRQRLYWSAARELGDPHAEQRRTGWRPERCERGEEGQPMPPAGGEVGGLADIPIRGTTAAEQARRLSSSESASPWTDYRIVVCRDIDKRTRRNALRRVSVEPGAFPLAAGLPRRVGPGSTREQRMELVAAKANRVGRLRGYGNAIVPQVAAEFIRAYLAAGE